MKISQTTGLMIKKNLENMARSYVFKKGTEIVQKRKLCILMWVHFDRETEPKKILP